MPQEAAVKSALQNTSHSRTPPLTQDKNDSLSMTANPHHYFQKKQSSQDTPLNEKLLDLLQKADSAKQKAEDERDAIEQAICTACALWENPDNIQRIEIISPDKINLPIIVLNRQGFLNEPHTWKENTQLIIASASNNEHMQSYTTLDQYIRSNLASDEAAYYLESCYDINLSYQVYPRNKLVTNGLTKTSAS